MSEVQDEKRKDFDYLFEAMGAWNEISVPYPDGPGAERLEQAAVAFEEAFARLTALGELPCAMAHFSGKSTGVWASVRVQKGLDWYDGRRDKEDEFQELYKYRTNQVDSVAADMGRDAVGSYLRNWTRAFVNDVIAVTRKQHSIITDGIGALYYSLVSTAYNSFETLAADMWIAVVDMDDSLGKKYMKESRSEKPSGNQEKRFSDQLLETYDYNLQGKMGTALADSNRAQFTSLPMIKENYNKLFGRCVHDLFESEPNITVAEKLRHLIAHRSGRVDREFREGIEGKGWFSDVQDGELVMLDGRQVSDLVGACGRTASKIAAIVTDYVIRSVAVS